MKCLLCIFIVCILNRFINGQGIMEDENSATADVVGIDDRIGEPGKETIEISDNGSDPVFRRETEENSSNEKPTNNQDITVESDSSIAVQDVQALAHTENSKESDDRKDKKIFEETMKRFQSEMAAGDTADLVGQNPHTKQDHVYYDLGRRFVPQYKYKGEFQKNAAANENNELKPEKAPPELVLLVAKESALLGPDKQHDLGNEVDRKKILRSGDYWNGVWKEEVSVHSAARSNTPKKALGSVKAKIKPGTEFYKVVSRMKNISPRLLYIINKKQL